jgi:hypothetical protein
MATWRANKGEDAAMGVSLIAGFATFVLILYFCALGLFAWDIGHYGLFGRHPQNGLMQYLVEGSCLVVSLVPSVVLGRAIYRVLRKRWADL